jgi:hypothetical protein
VAGQLLLLDAEALAVNSLSTTRADTGGAFKPRTAVRILTGFHPRFLVRRVLIATRRTHSRAAPARPSELKRFDFFSSRKFRRGGICDPSTPVRILTANLNCKTNFEP